MIKVIRLINDDKIIGFASIMEDPETGTLSISIRNPFLLFQGPDGKYVFEDYLPDTDKETKHMVIDPVHILYGIEPSEFLQSQYNEFTGMENVVSIKPMS